MKFSITGLSRFRSFSLLSIVSERGFEILRWRVRETSQVLGGMILVWRVVSNKGGDYLDLLIAGDLLELRVVEVL